MDLVADIGATNTRCALVDAKGQALAVERFENERYGNLDEVLDAYLKRRRASDKPRRAGFAIAAPVLGDQVDMINIDWRFSQRQMRDHLGLSKLIVVNDFAAIAHSLPYWQESDIATIGEANPVNRTPMAVLGPGSGLGVATLVPGPEGWNVAAGEGGHVTLPAADRTEAEIIELARQGHGHCSAERLLSGPGMVLLYQCVAKQMGHKAKEVTPEKVSELADQGDLVANKTLGHFFCFLGTVASDLALTIGALGGVFIAGGIVPALLDELRDSEFRNRFESKGRYAGYMKRIPTYVLLDPVPAFRGLTRLLGYRT